MNNKISIPFSSKEELSLISTYFARMEVVEDDGEETVSMKEAVTVIDTMYDVAPCIDDASLIGQKPEFEFTEKEAKERLGSGFSAINYNPCKFDKETFDYTAQLKIFISHPKEPYKLLLDIPPATREVINNDGTISTFEVIDPTLKDPKIISTKKVVDNIVMLEKFDENGILDVKYPITGNLKCEGYEIISYDGSVILVKPKDFSPYTKISFDTEYDLVTVKVFGGDNSSKSCECRLLYMELVIRETIDPPEEDIDAVTLIGCKYDEDEEEEEEEEEKDPCFKRFIYRDICDCSGTVKDAYAEVREIPCPESGFGNTSIAAAIQNQWEAEKIDQYVSCEDEIWEGHEKEFYEENCCEPPPRDKALPTCQHRTRTWFGGADIIKGRDHYYNNAFHDEQVILIPVYPPSSIPGKSWICGTIETIYEVESKNCCDDEFYENLYYEWDESSDVVPRTGKGVAKWGGGEAPYTVLCRGAGFLLSNGYTSIVTNGNSVDIFTDGEGACGPCTISISDGCSTVSGNMKSDDGQWVVTSTGCTSSGAPPDYTDWTRSDSTGTTLGYQGLGNIKRQVQVIGMKLGNRGTFSESCGGSCCWQDLPHHGIRLPFCPDMGDYCMEFGPAELTNFMHGNSGSCHDNCGMAWTDGVPAGGGDAFWYATRQKIWLPAYTEEWKC